MWSLQHNALPNQTVLQTMQICLSQQWLTRQKVRNYIQEIAFKYFKLYLLNVILFCFSIESSRSSSFQLNSEPLFQNRIMDNKYDNRGRAEYLYAVTCLDVGFICLIGVSCMATSSFLNSKLFLSFHHIFVMPFTLYMSVTF